MVKNVHKCCCLQNFGDVRLAQANKQLGDQWKQLPDNQKVRYGTYGSKIRPWNNVSFPFTKVLQDYSHERGCQGDWTSPLSTSFHFQSVLAGITLAPEELKTGAEPSLRTIQKTSSRRPLWGGRRTVNGGFSYVAAMWRNLKKLASFCLLSLSFYLLISGIVWNSLRMSGICRFL